MEANNFLWLLLTQATRGQQSRGRSLLLEESGLGGCWGVSITQDILPFHSKLTTTGWWAKRRLCLSVILLLVTSWNQAASVTDIYLCQPQSERRRLFNCEGRRVRRATWPSTMWINPPQLGQGGWEVMACGGEASKLRGCIMRTGHQTGTEAVRSFPVATQCNAANKACMKDFFFPRELKKLEWTIPSLWHVEWN